MDRTTAYAEGVRDGGIIAGPHVRAACARHLRDLDRADLRFDREGAERAIRFFELMKIGTEDGVKSVGEAQPWQCFVIGSIVGWSSQREGRWVRRFGKVYVEAGRASGKTPMGAFIVMWLFLLAKAIEPECFFAAGGGDRQAHNSFMDLIRFIENEPALGQVFRVMGASKPNRILTKDGGRGEIKRVAVQTDGSNISGMRVFAVLMDEYHEADSPEMMRQFQSAAIKRRNAGSGVLIFTNSGQVPGTPCWDERLIALDALDAESGDDNVFGFVCGIDEGDDKSLEETWHKANPGMMVGVPSVDRVRSEYDSARGRPSLMAHFEQYFLCNWSGSGEPFVEMPYWEKVQADVPDQAGCPEFPSDDELAKMDCIVGVDLGQIRDLTSVAPLWYDPFDPTKQYARVQNFTPRSSLAMKKAAEGTDYPKFAELGYIAPTAGETTDWGMVADYIKDLTDRFNVKGFCVDQWRWIQLRDLLEERGVVMCRKVGGNGIVAAAHPHGFAPFGGHRDKGPRGAPKLWMNESIETLESAIVNEHILVKFNPLLTAAVLGAQVVSDGKGNRAFTKRNVKVHDDPLLALVTASGLMAQFRRSGGDVALFSQLPDDDDDRQVA